MIHTGINDHPPSPRIRSPHTLPFTSVVIMTNSQITQSCFKKHNERKQIAHHYNKALINAREERLMPENVVIPKMTRENGSFPVYIGKKKLSLAFLNKNNTIEAIYYKNDNHSILDISTKIIVCCGKNNLSLLINFLCNQSKINCNNVQVDKISQYIENQI